MTNYTRQMMERMGSLPGNLFLHLFQDKLLPFCLFHEMHISFSHLTENEGLKDWSTLVFQPHFLSLKCFLGMLKKILEHASNKPISEMEEPDVAARMAYCSPKQNRWWPDWICCCWNDLIYKQGDKILWQELKEHGEVARS